MSLTPLTEPEFALKSRYALPERERLVNERFVFRYFFLDKAFKDLAGEQNGTEPSDFAPQSTIVSS